MSSKASARPEQNESVPAVESQSVSSPEENGRRGLGPVTPGSVLSFLYNRVRPLDTTELEFLSEATECASHMASNLAETVSNVGCMINWDDQPGKIHAGNFTIGENVSALLFTIADQMRVINELTWIGSEASSTLLRRERGHV